ncbi:LysR family transcriptional regulator [Thalassotalea fonticola]|uniref:LysR family transcriptional regulator n=1 Tax=Thalassotalea fonticola TaxID=3065649 RepID=A0ABZ0GU68_9GAMM|nr:LysR family transcriptional regulator [Colwelliaceae bacterium S1-1]
MNWDDIKIFLQVARTGKLALAARNLKVDSSTVSRRLHYLEKSLEVSLFERGAQGHLLTVEGQQLMQTAKRMEQNLQSSVASLQGINKGDSGNVRLGTTEAFGSFFLATKMREFARLAPKINVDILTFSRQVNLTRYEADIAINVGKPDKTSMVVTKLCDYRLKLYASNIYLRNNPITKKSDLNQQSWIAYVEHLDFSDQLSHVKDLAPDVTPTLKSSSVISQYLAVKSGLGIAVLPCFMADLDPELKPLLDDEIDIVRQFYLMAQADRKRIARVEMLWNFIKKTAKANQLLLMGNKRV